MLLSPSRADCIIFELEGVLAATAVSDNAGTEAAASPEAGNAPAFTALYAGRWDKLPLPAAVVSSLDRETAGVALKALGWDDLPASRLCLGEGALESACRSLGCRWPLVLASSPSVRDMAVRLDRGDFVAVGQGLSDCPIRFSGVADALRAILGIV